MEKIVKVVDEKRGIVQITTADERWYAMPAEDVATKLPVYEYVPSVTWIASYYPKGVGFYKWLANTGWDEAQAIKEAAGGRGSKVHLAIEALIFGVPVAMEDSFNNPNTGKDEPLTLEEYEAILSFKGWWDKAKPKVVSQNVVVWSKDFGYAGTLDLVCLIEGKLWIVDFKTSQSVWMSHEIQVSAYKHANPAYEGASLAILQLGYKRNKDGFKWNPVDDQMDLFLAARRIWQKETQGEKPKQRDYPISISLESTPAPKAEQDAHAVATD